MRLLPMLSSAAALATTRTAKRFSRSTTAPTTMSTASRRLGYSSSHGDPINLNCNLLLSILDDDDEKNNNSNPSAPSLRNDFFALRHGQSEANVAGLIASDPAVACHKFGLSATGQQQAQKAAQEIIRTAIAGSIDRGGGTSKKYSGIAVISSDLLRAKETAELAVQWIQNLDDDRLVLHTGGLILDTRLRERGFGAWDGTADSNYPNVWKDDALDSSHTVNGVESVDSVMRRATELVVEYDQKLENHMIVLTAHGDVLQILQTAFMKLPGTQHRTVEHLETATLRRLNHKTLE